MAGFGRKQQQKQAFLKMGLYGPPGSGKTLTALLIAEGLANGKKIAYVDTERGTDFYGEPIPERVIHPAAFDFEPLYTRSIMETVEAVESLDPSVYSVLVIDSVTHLWDAAREAYTGKKTSTGGIPIQAWDAIKRPWNRMIKLGMDGDFHFIICAREGVEMGEGADGEMVVTGRKMKAEGQTAYEPHLTARMVPKRNKDNTHTIVAVWEKDRSGVLSGKATEWPNYATIAPVVAYLTGGHQPHMDDPEVAAAKDAEAQAKRAESEAAERNTLFTQIKTAINGARTLEELRSAWGLTSGKKGKLGDLYEQLETLKDGQKTTLMKEA